MQTFDFLGLPLIAGNFAEIASWLSLLAREDARPPRIISHVNANNYFQLCREPRLATRLADEAYLLFDGIGMKLSAWLLSGRWVPDLNGTDLFPLVMTHLERSAVPVYFLGAEDYIVARAVKNIHDRWPGIQVAGFISGHFAVEDEDRVVREVNASGAKVLLVGRGFPQQELFSFRHRQQFEVSLIWNVGGLFDFVSEVKPRAPEWICQMRLEWLFRLLLEPKRLWQRTLVVGPWLLSQILWQIFFRSGNSKVKENSLS